MPIHMQRVGTFEGAVAIQKFEIIRFLEDGFYIRETHIKEDRNTYKPEAKLDWEVLVVAGWIDAARSRKGEAG